MEQYHELDAKLSSSRSFRGQNLHPKVTILCTLSVTSLFPSDIFFKAFSKLKRIT